MKTILTYLLNPAFEEYEAMLPSIKAVCQQCDGTGKHDHPSFSGGISYSEFEEDEDFHRSYMRGDYDVTCELCEGERVISVIDDESLTKEQREDLSRAENQRFQNEREAAYERKYCC